MNQMTQYRNNGMPMAHFDTFSPTRNWRKPLFALLLIISLTGLGGKAWGQTWPNGTHVTGADGYWNLGYNGQEVVTISGTIYVESPIYVICFNTSPFDPNSSLTIRPYNNGTCTIKRGTGYTGPIFKVMHSNAHATSLPGKLIIEPGVTIDGENVAGVDELIHISNYGTYVGQCELSGTSSKKITLQNNKGGAINNEGSLVCQYTVFKTNSNTTLGGAINSIYSCSLESCEFTSNSSLNGGAVFAQNTFSANSCVFTTNTINTSLGDGSGGAIYYGGSVLDITASVSNCTLNGNTAVYKGGAIILHNILTYSKMTLSGNLIYNNTANYGGGIAVHGTSTLTMSSGEIYKNTARNDGAGVHVMSGTTFTLNGGAIGKAASSSLNTATSNGGGVYNAGTFTMTAGSIFGGKAANGGGVYNAGTFNMNGGIVGGNSSYKNTATSNGGGVYNTGTFSMGGNVTYNTATANGGGVYNTGTFSMDGNVTYNSATANGGGVYVASGSTFTMGSGTEISNNTATVDGAGLYLASNFTLTADRTIHTNTATKNGGGVYVASGITFTMTGGVIHSNTSSNTAIGTGGGGVYTESGSTFSMSGGEIYHNTANSGSHGSGGGVLSNGTFNMSGGDIGKGEALNNTANRNIADHGGGVFVNDGTFTMSGTAKIHGNTATNGGGVYLHNGSFTMNNGEIHYNYATSNTRAYGGAGVYVEAGKTFTMNGGAIFSNRLNPQTHSWTDDQGNTHNDPQPNSGGGICTKGTVNMTGGTIGKIENGTNYPNHTRYGGGVYVDGTGVFNMTGGEVVANTCTHYGAGVYVYTGGTFTMDNATIHHNTASSHGGGIYTLGSVTATDNNNNNNTKIYNNTVTGSGNDGGGVYVGEKGSFAMTNGEIYSNTSVDGGGGIHIVNQATSSCTLTNCNIYSNRSANGAGLYKGAASSLSITGGEFYSNVATTNGGAINIAGGTVTLTGVSIGKEDNNAYLPNTAKVGGGIYMAAGTLTIQKNSAKADTKSYIIGNNTIAGGTTGGGIHKEAGTLEISDTEIKDNTSTTAGGGLYSKAGATTITDTEISGNTSTTTGGGIHMADGTLNISDTEITGNTATTTGGGIHMVKGTLNLSDTEISGNTATTNGGGIYHAAGNIYIIDSEITGNTATTYGGGIHKAGGNIYVSGVVVINNNLIGAATSNLHIANANTKFIYIAAAGLKCGSCIGITSAVGYSSNTKKIVQGDGTGAVPNDNCAYAYRNHFFFSDNGADGVFNNNASPYYSGNTNSLYFVANATYQGVMNSWLTSANATGCTLDGNGFVTAVNNAAGMAYFAQHILAGNDYSGKTVSLTADIDLSGHNWEPIGYAAECLEGNGTIFNGTFDGQGHTIANITSPFPYDNMGLFGAVGDDGVVKNTVVANINFTGTNTNTGAVAGLLNGAAYNCSAITLSGTGATAASLVGELGADGSLMNCFVNTSATNGLADVNGGTIANCYMRGATSFVGGGTGDVDYCYAPSGSVSGTNSVYGATALVNGKYGFAHSDQQITANSDNTYITNGAIDNRGELKGLLATLNNWVRASGNGWNAGTQSNSNGYALWTRTMASPINGDYPVPMYDGMVCVGSPDGTQLDYAADINTLLGAYSSAGDIYLYATNPTALNGTSGTTRVYINEHVGVQQVANTSVNARVGVTLDNSSSGYMDYDWHMFSSALTAAPMGVVYNTNDGTPYDVLSNYSSYYANGIPHSVYTQVNSMDPPKTDWNTTTAIGYFPTNTPYGKWRGTDDPNGCFDFYCYAEPYCHWINFKREGALAANSTTGANFFDHWREPEDANHMHLNIPYENELTMTQGKGYLVDLSAPSMLMADGVLNNGDASGNVSVSVTATDINYTGYEYALKGVNLIGNPYQSYLDFDEFYSVNSINTYFILDADSHGYVSYTAGQSEPIAPQFLHPHQGFFVRVGGSRNLQFTPAMRSTTGDNFRKDTPHYPLVNLVCSDSQGRNDFTTLELDRPEAGGGEKVSGLHAGDASIWLHLDDLEWQTAFTLPGLHEVPVRFRAYNDGMFTIGWETRNADISYMHLIDNLTGMDIDCLSASDYVFEGKTTDYWSRFRLVFEYTDVDENDDNQTDSETFAFMNGDELVVNGPSSSSSTSLLQMFDLNGRCIFAKELHGTQNIVSPPKVSPGIYILRLTGKQGTRTQKMVINQ